jgi:hypothetical protein
LIAPLDSDPLVGLAPDQPPEAMHCVAFAADQLSMAVPPLFTVLGAALNFTLGVRLELTVTVCDWLAVPPMPMQLNE